MVVSINSITFSGHLKFTEGALHNNKSNSRTATFYDIQALYIRKSHKCLGSKNINSRVELILISRLGDFLSILIKFENLSWNWKTLGSKFYKDEGYSKQQFVHLRPKFRLNKSRNLTTSMTNRGDVSRVGATVMLDIDHSEFGNHECLLLLSKPIPSGISTEHKTK